MRLWHTDLISVLTREQLVAQWRELSAIAGAIQKKGTPNHILVNFVLNYDYDNFISYAAEVREKMAAGVVLAQSDSYDLVLSHTCPIIYEPTDLFLFVVDQSTVDKTTE